MRDGDRFLRELIREQLLRRLDYAERSVLQVVMMIAVSGEFYARWRTVCEDVGCDKSTFFRTIAKLKAWGKVEQTEASDGRSPGRYRFKVSDGAGLKRDLHEKAPSKSSGFAAHGGAGSRHQKSRDGDRYPVDTSKSRKKTASSSRNGSAAAQRLVDLGFNRKGEKGAYAAAAEFGEELLLAGIKRWEKKPKDKRNPRTLSYVIWEDLPREKLAQKSKQNAQLLKKQQVERQTKEQRDADLVRDANRLKWGEEKPASRIKRLEGLKVKYPDLRRMVDAALKNPPKASDHVIGLVYAS